MLVFIIVITQVFRVFCKCIYTYIIQNLVIIEFFFQAVAKEGVAQESKYYLPLDTHICYTKPCIHPIYRCNRRSMNRFSALFPHR